jgi:hypothetical protein
MEGLFQNPVTVKHGATAGSRIMSPIQVAKVIATTTVTLANDLLQERIAASPVAVGRELATPVDHYITEEGMNYYPALDFFEEAGGHIDQELLDAARNISWIACSFARDEIRSGLQSIFSNVSILSIQSLAYSLPGVAPARAQRP